MQHLDNEVKKQHTYVESIKQDKKWNLYHANLHSNATAYFKAAKKTNYRSYKPGIFRLHYATIKRI